MEKQETTITVRVSEALLERLEAIRNAEMAMHPYQRVTLSYVVRSLLDRGLNLRDD